MKPISRFGILAFAVVLAVSCGRVVEESGLGRGTEETPSDEPEPDDTPSEIILEVPVERETDSPYGTGLGGVVQCAESERRFVADEATGEAWCDSGDYVHRPSAAVSCPHVEGEIGPTANVDTDECRRDADCSEMEICTTGVGQRICEPRCAGNEDCPIGQVCVCAGRQAPHSDGIYGACVEASCTEDADCGDEGPCAQVQTLKSASLDGQPTWGIPTFHCLTSADECVGSGGACYWSGSRREVFRGIR